MKTNRPHGFTLLELIFTLLIASILVSLAVPSMKAILQTDHLASYRDALYVDLVMARNTALHRNQSVIACASSNGSSCNNAQLTDGWIIAVDLDNSGDIDANDELLKVQQQLKAYAVIGNSAGNPIIFDSRGYSPNTNGTVSICDDRGDDFARILTISPSGRVSRGGNPSCP